MMLLQWNSLTGIAKSLASIGTELKGHRFVWLVGDETLHASFHYFSLFFFAE